MKSLNTMDQRRSNFPGGINSGVDRGRQRDDHVDGELGGGRSGWNGNRNNTTGSCNSRNNHLGGSRDYEQIVGKDVMRERISSGSQEQYQQRQHLNRQQQQQQQQQQQHNRHDRQFHQQGGGSGLARKRSRSPSLPYHRYDSQQQQQQQQHHHSNTPNIYFPHNPSHDGNNNNMAYEETNDSDRSESARNQPYLSAQQNLPQPHLLSPPTSKQQSPPPAIVAVPPEKRRTLILSNIPSHIQFYHLQNFFQKNWNTPIQYCVLDRSASEAYVVFKFVRDAQLVWNEGRKIKNGGLDGKVAGSGSGSGSGRGKNEQSLEITADNKSITSLVELGVELRAVHFSNNVDLELGATTARVEATCNSEGDEGGGGERLGYSGSNHNDRRQYDSLCRSVSDGYSSHGRTPQQHQRHLHHNAWPEPSHISPASASIPTPTTINNKYYHPKTPILSSNQQVKNDEIQPSSIELQLQLQEEAEERAKWEAFQLEEIEWRKRRHVEYNKFIQSKNERSARLSTLEQKRDLLSKQEDMLSQQLPLHKKMLVMLKSKNATPSEQSTKMKEILSTSKRIVDLKTELKGLIKDIEKIKEEESILGVFRPTENRPIFSGNVSCPSARGPGKKLSLDRRTTMLKVQGFESDNSNEDAIMKLFSEFGTVTSVSLEKGIVGSSAGGGDDASTLVVLVNYENRIDAERAKSDIAKLNVSLTCTWYNPSASAGSDDLSPEAKGKELGTEEYDDDQGLYDDVYIGGEDNAESYYNGENADGDYDGDEDFVDYD